MTPETIPFKWQIHKLGEPIISDKIKAGGTPLKSLEEYWKNGTIPFVKIEDMTSSQKYLYKTRDKITEKGLMNSSAWIVAEQSILFSMYASYGEVVINKVPVSTNQAIIAITPSKNVELEYFYYYLANLKSTIYKYIRETTQKNLNAEIVKNFDFILPPLIEQRGIAVVLGTVDEAIRQTDSVIEKAEELKRGLMQRLLTRGIGHTEFKNTELGEIPKTWKIFKFEDIVKSTQLGTNDVNEDVLTGIPLIKMGNLTFGGIDLSKIEYIGGMKKDLYDSYFLNEGDFLFNTRNTPELVGKSAVWHNELSNAIYNNNIMRIHFIKNIIPVSDYISYIFSSDAGRKEMRRLVNQTTSVAAIYWKSLKKLKLSIPPAEEQIQITDILKMVDRKIVTEKKIKKQFEEKKKGLMQILLSGNIRVELREDGLHRIGDG